MRWGAFWQGEEEEERVYAPPLGNEAQCNQANLTIVFAALGNPHGKHLRSGEGEARERWEKEGKGGKGSSARVIALEREQLSPQRVASSIRTS